MLITNMLELLLDGAFSKKFALLIYPPPARLVLKNEGKSVFFETLIL